MDGKQTLVHIKREEGLDKVLVVLFTTSSAALDKKFSELYGAKFVIKPIKLQELHDTVKLLLSFCGD